MHPIYQSHCGWNQIQKQIFTNLGQGCSESSERAAHYFRNLLKLSYQLTDLQQQRQCINTSLVAFNKFQDAQGNIGQIDIPKVLPHSIQVFTDSERIFSSSGATLESTQVFYSDSMQKFSLTDAVNQKPEFDTNFASWRLLQKHVTDWMRKELKIASEFSSVSVEELSECRIFDSTSVKERAEFTKR